MSSWSPTRAQEELAIARRPLSFYAPYAAVLCAMSFNLVLCFVDTKVGGVGNGVAIVCEISIISIVLMLAFPAVDQTRLLVMSSAVFYLIGLAALRVALYGGALEIKPVRDLLIPMAFFLLGTRITRVRYADALVAIAAAIVVIMGLIEYAFPAQFTSVFDIAKFYIGRGSMHASQAEQSSNLFISGMRPEQLGGRNLLPFLGDHRVSSIFLEPVSAGNFGIIVFMWAFVRSLQTRRFYWGLFAASAVMIVLSDSRFGASFCVICALLALMPVAIGSYVAAALPAAALTALVVLPDAWSKTHAISNGFIGRVILSGHILGGLDLANWFGIETPGFGTFNSGYSYALGGIGILGMLIFWLMLWSLDSDTWQFKVFRNLVAAYYAVLLCISNSPFTIKTASLLWVLVGALAAQSALRGRENARASGRPVRGRRGERQTGARTSSRSKS